MSQASSGFDLNTGFHPFGGLLDPRSGNFLGQQGGIGGEGGFGFANSFLSSPLLAGGLAWMRGGANFGIPAFMAARDFAQTQDLNRQNQETLEFYQDQLAFEHEQALALANRVPNFFDPTSGQIFGPDAGFARPDLRGGFTQQGKPGGRDINANLITLPEFNVGQTALDAFRSNLPSLGERTIGFDPIGELDENELFGRLQGLGVLPDTDLSDVLGARLAGIGAAGSSQQQQRRAEVAALAPQFGGLENTRAALNAVDFQGGLGQALQGGQAVAQTREEELAAQQFVSTVAGNLSSEEERLNLAIGQFNRGSQFTVDQSNIGRELALAQTFSGLEANAANDPLQRTSFLIDAINTSLGLQSNMFQGASTNTLNALAAQIPLLQQNAMLTSTFLPMITPGAFAGVNVGGGGDSSFNIDLASGIGAGVGLAGGLSGGLGGGLGGGAGGGGLLGSFGMGGLGFI